MPKRLCPLCGSHHHQEVKQYKYGLWQQDRNDALIRDEHYYSIVECEICSFTMADIEGGERAVQDLYHHSAKAREVWDYRPYEALAPYRQMVEALLQHHRGSLPDSSAIDFGCGDGELLGVLHHEYGFGLDHLSGMDFNKNIEFACRFMRADLSNVGDYVTQEKLSAYNLAFCSHVLEHLWDPRAFLSQLRRLMPKGALMYVEVPDHSLLNDDVVRYSNLYCAQHINYFTLRSLSVLAEICGWEVVSKRQFITGVVPRAYVVLQAEEVSCKEDIHEFFDQKARFISQQVDQIIKAAQRGRVALWGVGGDLIQLIQQHEKLRDLLETGCIQLYDKGHAHKRFMACDIYDPASLQENEYPIYICPSPVITRQNMIRAYEAYGLKAERLINPYEGAEQGTSDTSIPQERAL